MTKSLGDVAVVLQARLHSERIPQKMIVPFAGRTLLDIAVEKLTGSRVTDKSQRILAVHEAELAAIGKAHGVNIFHRSERSARAEGVPLTLLYEWWDKLPFTYAVLINPCAPLLEVATIDRFIQHYLNTESDGLFGVIEKRNYIWDQEARLISDSPGHNAAMDTKIVKPYFEAAHVLYAGRLDRIGQGAWMGDLSKPGDIELFVVDELEAFDIDYPRQLEVGERLYEAMVQRRQA
jgi:CMP-N-acetylneuraminic acid synthetase